MLMSRVYNMLYEFAEARHLVIEKVSRSTSAEETERGTMVQLPAGERIEESRFLDPVRTPEEVWIEATSRLREREDAQGRKHRTHIALLSETRGYPSNKEVTALVNNLRRAYVRPPPERRAKARDPKRPPPDEDEDELLPSGTDTVVEVIVIFRPADDKKRVERRAADNVFLYPYYLFLSNPLEHYMASPTTLLSPAEGARMLRERMVTEKTMQRILRNDPVVIWLGAEAGRVIRVHMVSEATGYQDECRIVV